MASQNFFLQSSVAELEGRSGSEIVSWSEDDSYRSVNLGFDFKLFGSSYSTLYPGSNTYITAQQGSGQYWSLSLSGQPPYPGIHLGSSDNSWQRVWSDFGPDSSPDYWRIRYEGTASTGGSRDYPNIVYEATYFNPSLTGNKQYIEVIFGVHNRTYGVFGVTNGSNQWVSGGSINDYMSYVFESDLDGRNWRILEGYSIGSGQGQTNNAPGLADAGATLTYLEGEGNRVIDSSLTLTDVDDTNIESATISISSGFQSSEDVLAFTDRNGITGSWNSSSGTLTLTGSATKATYEQALESVTYNNTNNDNPNTANRTISWIVNDGDLDSASVTSTISISRLNDAPASRDKSVTIDEEHAYEFGVSDFQFLDVDSGDTLKAIRITSNPSNGQLRYDDAEVSVDSSGYTVLAANISRLSFMPDTNENGNGYASISFKVVDQSDAESTASTITFNVTPVNDRPSITNALSALQGEVVEAGHNTSDGGTFSGVSVAAARLRADDVDLQNGDQLAWSILGNSIDDYGQIVIDSSTGEWSYTLDNTKTSVQSLRSGDVRTSAFVARVSDREGLYVDQTVNVTIRGSEDLVRQFADHVIGYSSAGQANGGDRWAASQALGSPNTTRYGDVDTAWAATQRNASGGSEPDEFLSVGFRRPVKASGFVIHENYGNGFVRRVEAIDLSGNTHLLWQGEDNSPSTLSGFSVTLSEPTDYTVRGLKIWVDIDHSSDWEEIDAIELIGWATQETYQPLAPTLDPVAGNGVINAAEKAAGVTLTGLSEANSTVEIRWGGNVYTANTGSDRKWSLSVGSAQIPNDTNNSSITLLAIDSEGRRSSEYTRIVRITSSQPAPPEISLIAGDNRINTYEKSTGFVMQGRAVGCSRVEISWEGRSFEASVSANGSWAILVGGPNGADVIPNDSVSSKINVVGIDADGNRSESSERLVVIDTSTPNAPTLSSVTTDNTVSAAEKVQGIQLSGEAESGTTVRIEWGSSIYTAPVDSSGHWSVAVGPSSIPADDPRSAITLRAIDVAGNQSIFSRSRVSIDTEAPDRPVIGLISDDDRLSSSEVSRSVVVAGTAERESSVEVSWNGYSYLTTTNILGRWSLNVDPQRLPANGSSTTITASAIDAAGNRSGASSRAVTVDTTAPNIPFLNPVGQDGIVNAAKKLAGLVVSGRAEAGVSIQLGWGRLEKLVNVNSSGEWSVLIAKDEVPRDGSSALVVRAVDQAGNRSEPVSQVVIIDTTPPRAPGFTGKIGGDGVLTAGERELGLVISGTSEAGTSVDVSFAGLTKAAAVTRGNWRVTFDKSEIPIEVEQKQMVRVIARDVAGNVSDEANAEVVLRTAPPAAPEIETVGSSNRVNAALKASGFTVSGQAVEGVERIALRWGEKEFSAPVNRGRWSIKVAAADVPADGRSILTAVALTGGIASEPASVVVDIDTTAPITPSLNSVGQANVINAALKSAGISINGQSEVGTTISLQWGRLTRQVATGANGIWSLLVPTADIPQDGSTTLSVVAVDQHGNRSSSEVQSVLIDSVAPSAPILDAVAGDNVINSVERDNGITLTGRAEAGSSVSINFGGMERNVVAASSGRWSLQLGNGELPSSGVSTDVRVAATDRAGNQSTEIRRQVGLAYTSPSTPTIDLIASDNIVNTTEAQALRVQGTGDAGSEISLTIGSTTQKATVDQTGRWSLSLRSNQLPTIDGSYQVVATARNRSGLTSAGVSQSVIIDRSAPVLVSATVEGSSLLLDYSEAINASAVSPSRFGINAGRTSLQVQSVDVDPRIPTRLVLKLTSRPTAATGLSINYESNQQDEQVRDLAGNPLDRIRGLSATTFRSSLDVDSLADSYRFLQLTGSDPVQATGNSSDNTIVGNSGDNIINGGMGADVLTGLGGRDRFLFTTLRDSLLGQSGQNRYDRITDLEIGTDIIDGPSAVARGQISIVQSVTALDAVSIAARLTTAQFRANGAAAFSLNTNGSQRWFVAINDATAGYDATRDALVEITGFTGQLGDLQIA